MPADPTTPTARQDDGRCLEVLTVYGRDEAGAWHVTAATHPNSMDTICGKAGLRATAFATHPRQYESPGRAEACADCLRLPTAPSPARESGEALAYCNKCGWSGPVDGQSGIRHPGCNYLAASYPAPTPRPVEQGPVSERDALLAQLEESDAKVARLQAALDAATERAEEHFRYAEQCKTEGRAAEARAEKAERERDSLLQAHAANTRLIEASGAVVEWHKAALSSAEARLREVEGALATETAERVRCRDGWAAEHAAREAAVRWARRWKFSAKLHGWSSTCADGTPRTVRAALRSGDAGKEDRHA